MIYLTMNQVYFSILTWQSVPCFHSSAMKLYGRLITLSRNRECIKAGQLYKSPLHRLKLDKTGLNWPKLVKTGLFQKYHVLQTKSTYNVWYWTVCPYSVTFNISVRSESLKIAFSSCQKWPQKLCLEKCIVKTSHISMINMVYNHF